jgi:hypothetical protein
MVTEDVINVSTDTNQIIAVGETEIRGVGFTLWHSFPKTLIMKISPFHEEDDHKMDGTAANDEDFDSGKKGTHDEHERILLTLNEIGLSRGGTIVVDDVEIVQ